jgi:IMP dehydrogenase
MEYRSIPDGITFDDVLLVPQYSDMTPDMADVSTRLTASIQLNIPLISAPMDTVTESRLAIAIAQEGGIGIIHKNLSPDLQAREVAKVKRSENGVITDPVTLGPDDTVERALSQMDLQNVSGFPVTEDGTSRGRVVGILTRRDMKFLDVVSGRVGDAMTHENLIIAPAGTLPEQAEAILTKARVEKLLLVDDQGHLAGLITMRDIENIRRHPNACRDERGRLRVGAAVGVNQMDRVDALVQAEVDVVIVDTAHGHSKNVIETIKAIKGRYDLDVIAGNIATAEAAMALADAGADAIKVGIGPGSICTTRVISGVGVPQLTAIKDAVDAVSGRSIPIIADGGIRQSGDLPKAIGFGASCIMIGSIFGGLDESPGELIIHHGRRFKMYRGMGSSGAMGAGSADRYGQSSISDTQKFVPEGVEGRVPYRGSLAETVYQLVGGLRAAMGYCGTRTIGQLQERAKFVRVSGAGLVESHPHDIQITKESPNYSSPPLEQ